MSSKSKKRQWTIASFASDDKDFVSTGSGKSPTTAENKCTRSILCTIAKTFPKDLPKPQREKVNCFGATRKYYRYDYKRLQIGGDYGINGSCNACICDKQNTAVTTTTAALATNNNKNIEYAPTPKEYFRPGGTTRYIPRPEWFQTSVYIISSYLHEKFISEYYDEEENADKEDPADKHNILNFIRYSSYSHNWRLRHNRLNPFMDSPDQLLSSLRTKIFGKEGNTILHLAIEANAMEAAQAIILIELNTWIGFNPSFQQYKSERINVLKGTLLETKNQKGETPMILAAGKGNVTIVRTLSQCGVKLTSRSAEGASAIYKAACYGHADVIDCIFQYHPAFTDANKPFEYYDLVNLGNAKEATPLMCATQEGHLSTVRSLLKHGASVDKRNSSKMTALMIAAQYGHVKVCQLLVKHGADTDYKADRDRTPLYFACSNGHIDVVLVLVAAGCNLYFIYGWNVTMQQTLERALELHRNYSPYYNDGDLDATVDWGDEYMSVRTIRTMMQSVDPRTQVELMRRVARVERSYEIISVYTLLHQSRADIIVPMESTNETSDNTEIVSCDLHTAVQWITNVTKAKTPLLPTTEGTESASIQNLPSTLPETLTRISTQALIRAMTLPVPLLQAIVQYLPMPNLWRERISRVRSLIWPGYSNVAIVYSFDLIDEILEEGGFLYACDTAQIPAPIPYLSWCDWRRSFQSTSLHQSNNASHETVGNRTSSQNQFNVAESKPPIVKDERNPSILEARRQVGYLTLLDRYQFHTDIVSILVDAPYKMPIDLLQNLIRVSDIASVCRRCCVETLDRPDARVVNFEKQAAKDIIEMVNCLASWYWQVWDIDGKATTSTGMKE